MQVLTLIVAFAGGYFCGAIPFAVLVAGAHGIDILKAGSGNPGATNVKRVLGRIPGNLVFVLDLAKGAAPVLLAASLSDDALVPVFTLGGAIVGHSFSVFLGFRGGKGVAVTMGALAALVPVVVLVGVALWLLVFYLWRFVSLASLVFAASLPVTGGILWAAGGGVDPTEWVVTLVFGALIILRHRENIARLRTGEEHRFSGGKD